MDGAARITIYFIAIFVLIVAPSCCEGFCEHETITADFNLQLQQNELHIAENCTFQKALSITGSLLANGGLFMKNVTIKGMATLRLTNVEDAVVVLRHMRLHGGLGVYLATIRRSTIAAVGINAHATLQQPVLYCDQFASHMLHFCGSFDDSTASITDSRITVKDFSATWPTPPHGSPPSQGAVSILSFTSIQVIRSAVSFTDIVVTLPAVSSPSAQQRVMGFLSSRILEQSLFYVGPSTITSAQGNVSLLSMSSPTTHGAAQPSPPLLDGSSTFAVTDVEVSIAFGSMFVFHDGEVSGAVTLANIAFLSTGNAQSRLVSFDAAAMSGSPRVWINNVAMETIGPAVSDDFRQCFTLGCSNSSGSSFVLENIVLANCRSETMGFAKCGNQTQTVGASGTIKCASQRIGTMLSDERLAEKAFPELTWHRCNDFCRIDGDCYGPFTASVLLGSDGCVCKCNRTLATKECVPYPDASVPDHPQPAENTPEPPPTESCLTCEDEDASDDASMGNTSKMAISVLSVVTILAGSVAAPSIAMNYQSAVATISSVAHCRERLDSLSTAMWFVVSPIPGDNNPVVNALLLATIPLLATLGHAAGIMWLSRLHHSEDASDDDESQSAAKTAFMKTATRTFFPGTEARVFLLCYQGLVWETIRGAMSPDVTMMTKGCSVACLLLFGVALPVTLTVWVVKQWDPDCDTVAYSTETKSEETAQLIRALMPTRCHLFDLPLGVTLLVKELSKRNVAWLGVLVPTCLQATFIALVAHGINSCGVQTVVLGAVMLGRLGLCLLTMRSGVTTAGIALIDLGAFVAVLTATRSGLPDGVVVFVLATVASWFATGVAGVLLWKEQQWTKKEFSVREDCDDPALRLVQLDKNVPPPPPLPPPPQGEEWYNPLLYPPRPEGKAPLPRPPPRPIAEPEPLLHMNEWAPHVPEDKWRKLSAAQRRRLQI